MHITWKHTITLVYGILIGGGFLFGLIAWLLLPDFTVEQLGAYMTGQLQIFAESINLKDSIAIIAKANVIDLLRIYLCGICLVGLPILILFLFLKCFSIGFTACALLQHSFLLFCSRILYIPILFFSVSIACRFSLRMIQNQIEHPLRQLLQYTILFVGLLFCVLLISVLDGCSNYYYLQHI